jgi:hypothetical protein
MEFPISSPQLRVDLQDTGLGFVESHAISMRLPGAQVPCLHSELIVRYLIN